HAPGSMPSTPSQVRSWWLGLAALSPALLLLTLVSPWPWLSALIGRAHPLVLHFPIALLLLAAGMEAFETLSRGKVRFAPGLILFAGSFGAVLAAVCGFLLMRADAIEGTRVERHLIGGIAVAILAVVALMIQRRLHARGDRGQRFAYRAVLLALGAAVTITGHDGSALTHGENYLTEYLPWNAGQSAVAAPTFPTDLPIEQWAAYEHIVAPIFSTRCVSCHNSTNFKGKLVMDNWDALIRGGKSGPLWLAGKPDESLLVERMHLPLEDEKHMPPKKKNQPTAEEIALLELWLKAGAPAKGTPAMLATDQAWLSAAKQLPGVLLAAHNLQIAAAEEAHEIDPAKLAQARALVEPALVPLQKRFPGLIGYKSRDSSDLRVNGSLLGSAFGDAEFAALQPLREWIVDLDLSETALTDVSAPVLASMTSLRTLRLNGTNIGDATLLALAPLLQLESIALFRTAVTDVGARTLAQLPQLRRVYASETNISPDVLASLQNAKRDTAAVQKPAVH
ncbi:MAG TPA: c-type cytochrome domain-containing protein, partial [Opitutus sp.]|nr:c-type cytochrome domain-containing protein [Opitutus sp.]